MIMNVLDKKRKEDKESTNYRVGGGGVEESRRNPMQKARREGDQDKIASFSTYNHYTIPFMY